VGRENANVTKKDMRLICSGSLTGLLPVPVEVLATDPEATVQHKFVAALVQIATQDSNQVGLLRTVISTLRAEVGANEPKTGKEENWWEDVTFTLMVGMLIAFTILHGWGALCHALGRPAVARCFLCRGTDAR
jgi:hypothetical protein